MAPRRKGNIAVDDVIEAAKGMPLDAKQLVRNKEEQLDPASFEYGYKGMLTVNRDEEKLYLLSDHQNPTQETSWKVIGPYDDSALDARVTALENASPGEQVQANWNETDTTSKAFIQNKPTIPPAYDDTALATRVTAVENGKANTADLAPVATSGSYNDLGDKPTIPPAYDDTAIQAALAGKADASSLANVATSGSYNDLGDKPTIPEAYDDSALAARIAAVETTLPNKANTADLANVATSGSYNDLGDKPTIPEAYDDTALAGRVTAVETALPGKADSSSLATVATSGDYDDLTNKPTIPEAYDDTALSARVTALEGRIDADTQADWNETDITSPAFIQNKPTIPTPITIDAAMDAASENPVQNKVVLAAIGDAVDVVDTAVQGLDTRVTAVETALNLTALTDEEIAALVPA